MTAANQSNAVFRLLVNPIMQNLADPRSTAVDDCFCLNLRGFLRPGVFEIDAPQAVRSTSPFNPSARFDGGSTRLGIPCIEDDEPRVLDRSEEHTSELQSHSEISY